jgi:hypothetical protein
VGVRDGVVGVLKRLRGFPGVNPIYDSGGGFLLLRAPNYGQNMVYLNKVNKNMTEQNNFILYTDPNGEVKLNVFVDGEMIWLTQKMMAQLFDVETNTITYHLGEIFKNQELSQDRTNRKIRVVQKEGVRDVERELDFYNLDAIISVGYRVNSVRATQFRIWATTVLKDFIIKGFVLDDEKLKQARSTFDKDYFKELLERVRSIRASERRIYLQITDIFAECSYDYNPESQEAKEFYATVQNLFHYAITGQTAAEIVYSKANKNKQNMGLTTWKHSPSGRILQSDVTIAKNYLSQEEIQKLERTVSAFFDYIENIIENQTKFDMASFANSVIKFLSFNEFKILDGKGKISHNQAETKALSEYKEFNKNQIIHSDFEKELVKKLQEKS